MIKYIQNLALHCKVYLHLMFNFPLFYSMTKTIHRLSILTSVIVFSIGMIMLQGMSDTAEAQLSPPSDSVGDIHVRAIFQMQHDNVVVDNFKVVMQKSGYKGPDQLVSVKPVVEVWGAPDYTHLSLYQIADNTHNIGAKGVTSTGVEFDVAFEIYKNNMIFRTFAYEDCMISNYLFTTLHDYDETFSGVTQFVYADVFEFECEGYHPSSPLDSQRSAQADNKSSLDWESKQRSTWSEGFR